MEHVNILTKEAITMMNPTISKVLCIVGFSLIFALLTSLVLRQFMKNTKRANKIELIVLIVAIVTAVLMIVTVIIGAIFFRVPSGRYEYTATIDEENMTVAEYNEFMKTYNHNYCKNGVYHFEDYAD